ncbi:MAG: cyclic lactone autoinducer peptide [Clostridium sp.]|nr:cyclic lactone autoinducer peptide [Lachnospiraceae bacterium]CCZ55319.1 unknown [Clostridium sp. CAG:75]
MLNRFFGKYGKQIAQCALIVGIISSQGACRFCFHQPKLPESMKQLLGQQK